MNASTTLQGGKKSTLEEAKQELSSLKSVIESKNAEYQEAHLASLQTAAKVQKLQGEIQDLRLRGISIEQWIRNMEMDGSELKGDLRAYVLWFMQRNKDTVFHFREGLLPHLKSVGIQFLDKSGTPLREAQIEDKINSLLNKECGEGGNIRKVYPGRTKRGGHYQWTDVPNPPKQEVAQEAVSAPTEQLPLVTQAAAPSVHGYPDPTEEQFKTWEGPILQAMREGKRFDVQELKHSFRNNGRVNGFKFEAFVDDAIERIDAKVRLGVEVECWGRNVGFSGKENANNVY